MNDITQDLLLSLVMIFFVWRAIRQLFPASYRRWTQWLSPRSGVVAGTSGCDSGCGPCSGCGSAGGDAPAATKDRTVALSFHPPSSRSSTTQDAARPTRKSPAKPA